MTIETILVGAPPSPWGNGGAGGAYGGGLGYKNNIAVTYGTNYTVVVGGGAASQSCVSSRSGGTGAAGAVRIVWPGSTRQFPSTCVGTP